MPGTRYTLRYKLCTNAEFENFIHILQFNIQGFCTNLLPKRRYAQFLASVVLESVIVGFLFKHALNNTPWHTPCSDSYIRTRCDQKITVIFKFHKLRVFKIPFFCCYVGTRDQQ